MTPLTIIEALRKTDEYIHPIFMQGGCYQFHLFLKSIYPECKPYLHHDRDHVATEINGKLYDITGEVKYDLYDELTDQDKTMVEGWSFRKNNLLKLTECPACDEPIII